MEDFGYLKNKEKDSSVITKMLLFSGAVLSLFCFFYITISAYDFVYHDPQNSEIKLIKSPDYPIKIIAEDAPVNHELKGSQSIYDDLFSDNKSENKAQNPNFPDNPVLPSKAEMEVEVADNINSALDVNAAKEEVKPERMVTKSIEPQQPKKEGVALVPVNNKETVATKVIAPLKDAKLATPIVDSGVVKDLGKISGSKVKLKVQLAALNSKQIAMSYFDKLDRVHKGLFTGLTPYVKEIKIANKGTFYRLQMGNFKDQIAAEKFCQKYILVTSKNKSNCMVVE